jgi:hypothetical protein
VHYEDLTLCRYHRGSLDTDSWRVPLLAVGWLEGPYPYPRGTAPANLMPMLEGFVSAAGQIFRHECFRGLHECNICVPASLLRQSHINLLIPGDGVVYASPAGIVHYMSDHQYLPPWGFIDAVNHCPDYGSDAYLSALREANGGHQIPLRTWDECRSERKSWGRET